MIMGWFSSSAQGLTASPGHFHFKLFKSREKDLHELLKMNHKKWIQTIIELNTETSEMLPFLAVASLLRDDNTSSDPKLIWVWEPWSTVFVWSSASDSSRRESIGYCVWSHHHHGKLHFTAHCPMQDTFLLRGVRPSYILSTFEKWPVIRNKTVRDHREVQWTDGCFWWH